MRLQIIVFPALVASLALAGCGGTDGEPAEEAIPPTTTEATLPAEQEAESSTCARFAVNVYDILAPGASREEYLTLLHRLQRDCPAEARDAGLTGEGLPPCTELAQESCTMYEGP